MFIVGVDSKTKENIVVNIPGAGIVGVSFGRSEIKTDLSRN